MIQSLAIDVAALQQLPETEPLEASFVDGGLCFGGSVQVNSCAVAFSCNYTQGSTPKE